MLVISMIAGLVHGQHSHSDESHCAVCMCLPSGRRKPTIPVVQIREVQSVARLDEKATIVRAKAKQTAAKAIAPFASVVCRLAPIHLGLPQRTPVGLPRPPPSSALAEAVVSDSGPRAPPLI
jgi:hypothetical protein